VGKITLRKVESTNVWKIESDGVMVDDFYLDQKKSFSGSYYAIEYYFSFSHCFELGRTKTLEEASELAKEIFKNKTSLRDRAFESALDYFRDREGEGFLTSEKCSEIFFSIVSDLVPKLVTDQG
jgi:hypothetical protein